MIRSQYLRGSPWFDPVWVNEWQEDRSARPVRSAVAASCRGTAFRWARNNLDDMARDVAGQVGGTSDEVALAQAVGCRRVADRYVMIVGVRLADGTALQTALEEKRGDGESSFSTVGARSVPRGREASYPRVVRLGDEDAPDVVRRAVLFAAPGGATAELVSGPSTVLARARLGADGIGVGTAAGPLNELLERDQGLVSVVVRDAAGKLLERVPVPAGHETEPEDPEGPVDPPVDGPAFPHRK
jgi:hypothetical protein